MVTFTRAVPILVYEPQPVTTLSPGMAGTMKLSVPELVFAGELVACGEVDACVEVDACGVLSGPAKTVMEGSAAAPCLCVGDAAGVADDPGVPVKAADPLAAADAAPGGVDPLAAHALRPAAPMTAAMITAGTPYILMLVPSDE
jgi:hypothetical protein